ncbi:MAG: GatB/YqeY domain-containing protein [Bacteroidales bacterium]|nr:GatB/YqeY domain-containing protein [Bacteroidales bacterium]
MSIFEQINEDIKKAMLAKEQLALTALRSVKAAFILAITDGINKELDDTKAIGIIQKLVKQRRESAEIYESQNRLDLAETEKQEAEIIAKYLPKALDKEELEELVKSIIAQTGANSMKDMGKVMSFATTKAAGRADGRTLSELVKTLLIQQ